MKIMNTKRVNLASMAIGCLLFASVPAFAIPAKPGQHTLRQPDNTTLEVTIVGDEHYAWYVTADGYCLMPATDGFLHYVDVRGGALEVSAVRAHDADGRSAAESAFLSGLDRESVVRHLQEGQSAALKRAAARRSAAKLPDALLTEYPTIGSPNAMILLVEFADEKFHTPNAHEAFQQLAMERGYSHNGATGSARDYYEETSNGLFTPEFKVYGPITLEKNMAYYGAATANSHDAAPWEMVVDACTLLKQQNPEINFADFDNDGDGKVDSIFIFYAGYGQNSGAPTSTIWPHSANLSWYGLMKEFDGVKIDNYACSNELNGTSGTVRCGIGTFCHEFGHVLGLPDLYSTMGSGPFTPGAWELMDTGPYNNNGNTPPYMCAFDRMSLRWLNPRELTAPETVELLSIDNNQAYIIKTAKEEEYYLLENRQQHGWDTYVPGHGMLAWHIDYDAQDWKNNSVNNQSGHQRVDIVEADGTRTEESRAGDCFPGRNGVTEFTDDSNPSMATWTGIRIGKPITDIREVDGVISFKILGGGDGIEKPVAKEATDITPVSFRANWSGSVTITDYEIDLCCGDEVVPMVQVTKHVTGAEDCWHEFTGLRPETVYRYVIRSVDGAMKSPDSEAINVTTLPPTFDMLSPVAHAADEITGESFIASWDALENADSYEIDVYRKAYITPTYDVVDFTGGLAELPQGWTTTAAATSAVAGTFGENRPSLQMKNNNDNLVSPTYDFDINGLSFWYGTNSSADGSLEIEGLCDGEWKLLEELQLEPSVKRTYSIDNETHPGIPMGCRSLRLTFRRTGGTLYLDDVTVAYKGQAEYLYVVGYEHLNVGNALACRVEGLNPLTDYFYSVTALSGDLRSQRSAEIAFTTTDGSSIESIETDGTITDSSEETVYYDLLGNRLHSPAPSSIVIRIRNNRPELIIVH